MNAAYFRTMVDYLYWCRDRLLAAAEGVTDEELLAPNGFTYGSILGILRHTLNAESLWFKRMRREPTDPPAQPAIETMAELKSRWREVESAAREFLAGLSDAGVDDELVLRGRDGVDRTWKLWQLLTIVTTHSKQHQSEAAEALTMAGRSPGDLDFPVFLRSVASAR